MRQIDTIDIEDVHVLPRLPKVGGPAKVEVRAYLRNMTRQGRARSTLVLSVDGERIVLKGKEVPARRHPHPDQDLHDRATRACGSPADPSSTR